MSKKKSEEEVIIQEAADIIMRTIHVASQRIAEKYERMLMNEVVARIQVQIEANEYVSNKTGEMLNNSINKLSQ